MEAAAQLAFSSQPGGGPTAPSGAPSLRSASRTAAATVVTTNNTASITLAIATQPHNGGTLSCSASPKTVMQPLWPTFPPGAEITGRTGTYTLSASASHGLSSVRSERIQRNMTTNHKKTISRWESRRKDAARDEVGAALILALVFLVAVSGMVLALAGSTSNNLLNSVHFTATRTVDNAASSTPIEVAVQHPLPPRH